MPFVLALDQGTTSCRAMLFDDQAQVRGVSQREFDQHYPQPGWVEHDAREIWSVQFGVATEALSRAGVKPREVAAIGITNQRETVVLWDRKSGEPVAPAIVWQDRRTAGYCDQLKADGAGDVIQRKTGLVIDAYFSASKLRWLLDHVPDARRRAESGELAFGTIDSWLIWNLTGGAVHATDATNASRTMLYNIHEGKWDSELLELFNVPAALLPEVKASSEVYATCSNEVFASPIPIAGVAGDQQAALFGQTCFQAGQAKNTYGTGCFMLLHTGEQAVASQNRLLTTIASALHQPGEASHDRVMSYALEGGVFIGGAVVQWLRDGLGVITRSEQVNELAATVEDAGDLVVVPAFAGLGSPHWDPYARGTIVGITRGTTAAHLCRAALEGIAHQVADVLDAMREDARAQTAGTPQSPIGLSELRVDGGAAASDLLMQFQADILQTPVVRPTQLETTALGAAFLAGLATGVWPNRDAIVRHWSVDRRFEPVMGQGEATARRERWREGLKRSMGWAEL